MPICPQCGKDNNPEFKNCGSCGTTLAQAGLTHSNMYFLLQSATRTTLGPMPDTAVREWINSNHLSQRDMITRAGEDRWVPILNSEFSQHMLEKINLERLSSTTCPRCNSALVAVVGRSGAGLWLIIAGVVLTPLIIGIPIWAVGFYLRFGGKGTTRWTCPRCGYIGA
jgi:ribosomal protein L37AE/L43A